MNYGVSFIIVFRQIVLYQSKQVDNDNKENNNRRTDAPVIM